MGEHGEIWEEGHISERVWKLCPSSAPCPEHLFQPAVPDIHPFKNW